MFTTLLRVSAAAGPSASWLAKFAAAAIAVFVLYIGIAMWATLRAADADQRKVRYQVFRDLLDLFRRGRDR
jgi:hypothetical protein